MRNSTRGAPRDAYVESIPSATSFTYRMQVDPTANADTASAKVIALFQVGRYAIENNVIELIPSINGWDPPIGIFFYAYYLDPNFLPFRIFRQLVIRNNIIRYVENLTEDVVLNQGIVFSYAEDALVENNVVDLASGQPIYHGSCTRVKYFNNSNSAGRFIPGALWTPGPIYVEQNEITTVIEDATILSI